MSVRGALGAQIDEDGEKTKKVGGKRKAGQEELEGGVAKKTRAAPKPNRSKSNAAKKKSNAKSTKGGGSKK
jgi:hypothetical protein